MSRPELKAFHCLEDKLIRCASRSVSLLSDTKGYWILDARQLNLSCNDRTVLMIVIHFERLEIDPECFDQSLEVTLHSNLKRHDI